MSGKESVSGGNASGGGGGSVGSGRSYSVDSRVSGSLDGPPSPSPGLSRTHSPEPLDGVGEGDERALDLLHQVHSWLACLLSILLA